MAAWWRSVDSTEDTYRNTGILVWNPWLGTGPNSLTNIDSLRYCVDLPYLSFFGDNLCESMTAEKSMT